MVKKNIMVKNNIQVIVKNLLYFGGDLIRGVVKLEVVTPIKSTGVRLLFTCFEETSWTGTELKYSASVVHFEYRYNFTGAPYALRKSAPIEVIQPGKYQWGFNLRLPNSVLPSFKFEDSGIRHHCCAYVDSPNAFNLQHKIELVIGGNYMHFTGPAPVLIEKKKQFWFGQGHLGMTISTQDSHVYMGDDVRVHVAVKNQSNKTINNVRVTLMQRITLYSGRNSRVFPTEESHKDLSIQIPKHSNHEFDFSYNIPLKIIPTIRKGMLAEIVDVRYEFKIELLTPWSSHLWDGLPISPIRRLPTRTVAPRVIAAPQPTVATQEKNTVVGDVILAELSEFDDDEERYLLA